MKKIIALLLVAAMCVTGLAACNGNKQVDDKLDRAIENIDALYKKELGFKTTSDYSVVSQVRIDGTVFKITWTTDREDITVVERDNDTLIDINEKTDTEIAYTLTATVSDENGNTKSVSFKYTIPVYVGYGAIVDALYALEDGQELEGGAAYTIEGTVIAINTAYGAGGNYITVTFVTDDRPNCPIQCFKLVEGGSTDVAKIDVGDRITAKGALKNYKGTFEFNGCTLESYTAGSGAQSFANADALLAAVEALV